MTGNSLLPGLRPRAWAQIGSPAGIRPVDLYVNPAVPQVEVVYAESSHGQPTVADTRRLWKLRSANRPSAVLLVVGYEAPDGIRRGRLAGLHDGNVTTTDPSLDSVATAAEGALRSGSTKRAESMLGVFFERVPDDHPVVGLRNEGLFATHELVENVPRRADWADAVTLAGSLIDESAEGLVRGLGWTVRRHGEALLLGTDDRREAVAIILQGDEVFDRTTSRLGHLSPVEYAISVAQDSGARVCHPAA